MKTYLLDILSRYNRFSENLDVKTVLCNKSWWIFNDSGDKELYIFQENGDPNCKEAYLKYAPATTPADPP